MREFPFRKRYCTLLSTINEAKKGGISNSSYLGTMYLSNTTIFRFHDCGRKSILGEFTFLFRVGPDFLTVHLEKILDVTCDCS